jgi:hypothetical protein
MVLNLTRTEETIASTRKRTKIPVQYGPYRSCHTDYKIPVGSKVDASTDMRKLTSKGKTLNLWKVTSCGTLESYVHLQGRELETAGSSEIPAAL